MGIEIGEAHWAYSGFMRFRTKLAAAEGIHLPEMHGFGTDNADLPWTDVTGKDVTVLRPFLYHSDCDGELTWQECEQVVDRIEQIIGTWPEPADHRHERDIVHGRLLVAAMRESISTRTALEFT